MHKPMAVVLFLVLAGCASESDSDTQQIRYVEAIARGGNCDLADQQSEMSVADFGRRAYSHYYIASTCRKDGKRAIGYLTLSARYGNAQAQNELVKYGQPVPAPDLRPPESGPNNDALAAALILGLGQKTMTNCTTVGGITNCRSY